MKKSNYVVVPNAYILYLYNHMFVTIMNPFQVVPFCYTLNGIYCILYFVMQL